MTFELIVIGVLAFILLLFTLFNPYFGLIIFTAFLYIRPGDLFPTLANLHITRLLGAFVFLALIFDKVGKKESIIKRSPQLRWLSILVLIMIFSIPSSIWPSNALKHTLSFSKVFIGFLLIVNLISSVKRFRGITWIMVLSGLFVGVTAAMNYFQGANLANNYRARAIIHGMFSNPNDLALCFVMLIPFAYFLFLRNRVIFTRLLLGFSLIIFVSGAILTYSRSGALGLLAVVLLLFLRSKSKMKAIIGLSVFILLFFSFAPPAYLERIKTITTSQQQDVNTISRLDAWRAGIAMMTQRPFGVGVGNFGEGFVTHRLSASIDLPGMRRAAHNAFIQIGAETGIPGLIVYLLLIISTLKSLIKTRKISLKSRTEEAKDIVCFADATLVSLVGFIVCVFFLSQAYNWILYYLVGFSVVLREFVKEKHYEKAD